MKRFLFVFLSFIMAFSFISFKNENEPLASVSKSIPLNEVSYENDFYEVFNDEEFLKKLSNLSNYIYELMSEGRRDNYAVSPLSIYMALAILHNIGDTNVKTDIENLLLMSDEDIEKSGKLFSSLIIDFSQGDTIITKLDLTNSIWFDSKLEPNKIALKELAENYYCHAYKTPFFDNNSQANDDIKNFIKEKTNGLIDTNFELPINTVFAIINTLYFKDIWNNINQNLLREKRPFYINENAVEKEFLLGNYERGEVAETESSYYFYISTQAGYKLKLIIPKDGYSLSGVMNKENLNKINAKSEFYNENDESDHYTRCIFPKFKISSDTNLKEIFEKNGILKSAFSSYKSNLLETNLQVSDIKHKVVFDVNEKGIEGAAVTIMMNKAMSIMPEKTKEYHDFVIDKNFGFMLTTDSDIILFEGQVVN